MLAGLAPCLSQLAGDSDFRGQGSLLSPKVGTEALSDYMFLVMLPVSRPLQGHLTFMRLNPAA